MPKKQGKTRIIILAGGKGTRMKSDLPKVLVKLKGKPMIKHLLESVRQSGIDNRPVIVVGYEKEKVMKELGPNYEYVAQEEQLGTGHAVSLAKDFLKDKTEYVIVLYGDHPLVSPKAIKNLAAKSKNSKAKIIFTTTKVKKFTGWQKAFTGFGRIIRKNKKVSNIKEYRDATEKEKSIKEVNAGYYIFNASWLWKNLEKIKNNNIQKEYYLTDLVQISKDNKDKIETVNINLREALGANSKEELEILEHLAPKN